MTGGLVLVCLIAWGASDGAPAQSLARAQRGGRARQPPASPSEEFRRGKNAFDRGEYGRAVEVLRPLLYPELRLESEGEIVQTHRMLGVAHLFEEQNDMAAQEFRKLLQLRPDYRFDPLLDPPRVVDFFNGVLREHDAALDRLEARRREAEVARNREAEVKSRTPPPRIIERRVGRNSFMINFVPFGAGQFQNGQRAKGWSFLAAESILGTVSVAAFTTNFALYGIRAKRDCTVPTRGSCPRELVDRTDERRSQMLLRVQLVSGGLFFATVAWGIADAILNFVPEVPLASRVPAGDTSPSWLLAPTAVAGGVGPGLFLRF